MSEPPDVPFPDRSTEPCPRCGRHDLALTQPPHVPVMGAQPYTEIYRLGDLPMPVGVRCRSCGTTWPTIEALRAGEPGTSGEIDPVEGLETSDEAPGSGGPEAGATAEPPVAASSRASRQAGILALSVVLVAVLLLAFLFANVLFVPLVVLLMAAGLVAGYLRRPRA